ncbi:MAG: sulfatase-like hydrolase/transferase [Flavobacteriaceae bacterium]|nr:sulfatase-like hydrolase/transferase [Flavobacteriaceae bacterium]
MMIIGGITLLMLSCNDDSNSITDNIIDSVEAVIDEDSKPNILLIIADDMGLDASPGYSIGTTKPNMPNLQEFINNGVVFNNLWSYPTCSPTRSSILTGKYGLRTGVNQVGDILSTSETSLQQHIDNLTGFAYSHAVIGKWHLSTDPTHPEAMGVGSYAGLLTGATPSYSDWSLTENATTTTSTEYISTKFTDLAIDWVENQATPWFLWLAYTAPHTPFHLPPLEMHSQGALPEDQASIDANPLPYYMAMMESIDYEIGRLLSSMSEEERNNTIIIFVGDNGSPSESVQVYNSNRAKGTIYNGGIAVPMIVSGKNVTRINTTDNTLINTTDLFATIADIAGTGTTEINDSKSFKSLFTNINTNLRDYIYSEKTNNDGTSDYAIRNVTHKYISFADGSEALYDLSSTTFESNNLMDAAQLPLSIENALIKDELLVKVNEIRN